MPLFKSKNSSKATKNGLVPSGSSSNISDYLPANACRRNSWCDVSLDEFLDYTFQRGGQLEDDRAWEFKLARLEEIDEARAELGLAQWKFNGLYMDSVISHWHGIKIVHVYRLPLNDGFEDEDEESMSPSSKPKRRASNGSARCRRRAGGRGRRGHCFEEKTPLMKGLTDNLKNLVGRGV